MTTASRDFARHPCGRAAPGSPFATTAWDRRPDAAVVNYAGNPMSGLLVALWLRAEGWTVHTYYVAKKRQRATALADRPRRLIVVRDHERFVEALS